MRLAELGVLSLDARIGDLLPTWQSLPAGRATVRQLAGHLAGVRHYRDGEGLGAVHYADVMETLEIFEQDSILANPGEKYSYSTYGYSLLSAILQSASGQPFLELMQQEVFRPLGMRYTGPDDVTQVVPDRAAFYELRQGKISPAPFTDNSYKWAGGGFLSTPEDLVRFGEGLLGGRLIASNRVASLFESQRTTDGRETRYGMGFRSRSDHEGRPVVHHGGSSEGARSFLLLYPERGLVVALVANRATAPLFEQEAQTFAHLFLDHGTDSDGGIDDELSGRWIIHGALGKDSLQGDLRLFARGPTRGLLTWSQTEAPIRIVLVDRHSTSVRLIGVGPHGVMNAWLDPSGPDGWTGSWEYLGQTGAFRVRLDGAQPESGTPPTGEFIWSVATGSEVP
jgi:CubicO group peptidase (beta-lactamase class C family)